MQKEIAELITGVMNEYKNLPQTREVSLSFTKLEEAMLWLMASDIKEQSNAGQTIGS